MQIYLAQPLWATSDLQQATMRDAMIRNCNHNLPGTHTFLYTRISPFAISKSPLGYLARSLMDMATADAVLFCHAWQTHRDCAFLYEVAKHYLMPTYEIDHFPWALRRDTAGLRQAGACPSPQAVYRAHQTLFKGKPRNHAASLQQDHPRTPERQGAR